jgi:hypothetical protein
MRLWVVKHSEVLPNVLRPKAITDTLTTQQIPPAPSLRTWTVLADETLEEPTVYTECFPAAGAVARPPSPMSSSKP